MTESEQPKAPEHFMNREDDEKNDTEGHLRIAFQGDESGAEGRDDEDDDTQGHMRVL